MYRTQRHATGTINSASKPSNKWKYGTLSHLLHTRGNLHKWRKFAWLQYCRCDYTLPWLVVVFYTAASDAIQVTYTICNIFACWCKNLQHWVLLLQQWSCYDGSVAMPFCDEASSFGIWASTFFCSPYLLCLMTASRTALKSESPWSISFACNAKYM